MKKRIKKLVASLIISGLGLAGGAAFAAEFEVLDRFSVDGYTMLRGSADISGGNLTVGGSAFAVQNGKVGVGTTSPGSRFEVAGGSAAFQGDLGVAGYTSVTTISVTGAASFAAGITASSFTAANPAGPGLLVSSSAYLAVLGGNVGIGTTDPVANLDVAGGIKVGTVNTACASNMAGTLRWYDGHISVCNSEGKWRQLDNQPPPTITSITPASGLYSGGTAITIIGTGFTPGYEITIGGVSAANTLLTGTTQITATTPAGTVGARDVKITNSDGQYITGTFTYNPLLTLASVTPNSGRLSKTTNITIAGTGFVSAGLQVTIGGVPATVNSVTSTQITAVAPAIASAGAKDVTVTDPAAGSATQTNWFTYAVFATGGSESNSGGYNIHTFTSNGTFTANFAGTVEVYAWGAGGGGGGNGASAASGGSGGGGAYASSSPSIAAGALTVIVGGGGGGSATACVGSGGGGIGYGGTGGNMTIACSGPGGGGGGGSFLMNGGTILVAAGGGGGGGGTESSGGAGAGGGGGVNGGAGTCSAAAGIAGGNGSNTNGANGGTPTWDASAGGAGGGGYIGGTGGGAPTCDGSGGAGGGGGSSFGTVVNNGSGTTPGNSGSSLRGSAGNGGSGSSSTGNPGILIIQYPN